MEKIYEKILLVCFVLFICSCELTENDIEVGSLFVYDFNNDIKVESLEDAVNYVAYDIKYKSDPPGYDYWQTPEETETLKTGDCEDKAILLMYLLNKMGIDSWLLIVEHIITQDNHALVFSNNKFLESTNGSISEKLHPSFIIKSYISYYETIWMTVFYHNNVGKYE